MFKKLIALFLCSQITTPIAIKTPAFALLGAATTVFAALNRAVIRAAISERRNKRSERSWKLIKWTNNENFFVKPRLSNPPKD